MSRHEKPSAASSRTSHGVPKKIDVGHNDVDAEMDEFKNNLPPRIASLVTDVIFDVPATAQLYDRKDYDVIQNCQICVQAVADAVVPELINALPATQYVRKYGMNIPVCVEKPSDRARLQRMIADTFSPASLESLPPLRQGYATMRLHHTSSSSY